MVFTVKLNHILSRSRTTLLIHIHTDVRNHMKKHLVMEAKKNFL